jgi:hypothetical protein
MLDELSFMIKTSEEMSESCISYLQISVSPLVNGIFLLRDDDEDSYDDALLFDAMHLLARGTVPGECNLFTCACGDAGCAGIFDNTQFTCENDIVSWIFPDGPFKNIFSSGIMENRDRLEVKFSKDQYEKALQSLTLAIKKINNDSGLAVHVDIGNPSDPDFKKPLWLTLSDYHTYLMNYIKNQAIRKERFGELLGAYVNIEMSNGTILTIDIESYAHYRVNREAPVGHDEDAYLDEVVVTSLAKNHTAIIDAIKLIDWEVIWGELASLHSHSVEDNEELDSYEVLGKFLEPLFSSAVFSLCLLSDEYAVEIEGVEIE